MKPEMNLPKAPKGMNLFNAIKLAWLAFGKPVNDYDDDDFFDENGRRAVTEGWKSNGDYYYS